MKFLFTLINLFLVMIIALLIYMHFSIKKNKPEPVLKKTPEKSSLTFKEKNKSKKTYSRISVLWQNNLFEPLRGKEASEEEPKEEVKDNGEMELIGIFRFGKVEKAIILIRSGSRTSSRHIRGNRRPPYRRPGRRPAPVPATTKQEPPQKSYSVGEKLSNGYELKEIHDDKVILVKGNLKRELKLEYDDGGSSSRITASFDMAKKRSASLKASSLKTSSLSKPPVRKNKLPAPPPPPPPGVNNNKTKVN